MQPSEYTRESGKRRVSRVDANERSNPSDASAIAAISLLSDEQPAIAKACREQIISWGDSVRHLLEQTATEGELKLRRHARTTLRTIDLNGWSLDVARYAEQLPRQGQMTWQQLEAGAVLLSGTARSDQIDAEGLAGILDGYAEELRPRFAGKSAMTCSRLLAGYLSSQLGYNGSRASFYELSNVHFDKVVGIRRGVPVALTLLYILVGRRAGLEVSGVAIPDHFLVRVHGTRPVLLDPYHEGRQVTKADCVRYLRNAGYSLHTTSYLEDVSDRRILDCLLRDLLRVYGFREDNELCTALENARQVLVQA